MGITRLHAKQVKESIPLYNLLNSVAPRTGGWWIYTLNPTYESTGITAEGFPEGTIISAEGFFGQSLLEKTC